MPSFAPPPLHGSAGQRDGDDAVAGQRTVFERIGDAVALRSSAGGEGVLIDDEDAAWFHVLQAPLERGGIHGDEGIEAVAGRVDFGAAELDLETRDAGQCADRSRISAGKSGKVLMSLPRLAEVLANSVPTSCIPSPESPQKPMVACSNSTSGFSIIGVIMRRLCLSSSKRRPAGEKLN